MLLWDILICDDAYYHWGGACRTLEDFLWEEHKILIIYLPARTPEWNPMELVWSILVRRLGLHNLSTIRNYSTNKCNSSCCK